MPDKQEVPQPRGVEEDSAEPPCEIMVKSGFAESEKKAAELSDLDRILNTKSYNFQV